MQTQQKITHIRETVPALEGLLFFWSSTPEVRVHHSKLIHSQHGRETLHTVVTNPPIDTHEGRARGRGCDTCSLGRRHSVKRIVKRTSCCEEGKSDLMGNDQEKTCYLTPGQEPFTQPSRFPVSSNPLPCHHASLFHQTLYPAITLLCFIKPSTLNPRRFWKIPNTYDDHEMN